MRSYILVFLLFTFNFLLAQKKPLDHTVYDGWQSIGERMISNDGKWVVYTVAVQEGDNELVIQSSDAKYKKTVARGYNAAISEDSRFAIFKIRPLYKETREARIKKKKPDDMPKDSFAVVELGKDSVYKVAKVKTYKVPEKGFGWAAYHLEKKPEPEKPKQAADPNKKVIDSLKRTIDSLVLVVGQSQQVISKKKKGKDEEEDDNGEMIDDNYSYELDAEGDDPAAPATPEGTDLVLKNLLTGEEKTFPLVSEYFFDKQGKKLLLETTKNSKDSLSKATVWLVDLGNMQKKAISTGGNDFKNFAFSEDGSQIAYVAERNAKPKDLQKFYKLWYYKNARPDDPVGRGADTASMIAEKNSVGMKIGMTVSEFGTVSFSKSGKRIFFGAAEIQAPRDTTLVDFELAKLDVWHYKDDYLQPTQLNRLQTELQRNYLAVYDVEANTIKQLGSKELPTVYQANEGDGETFVGVTDYGKRVEAQWTGNTLKDVYAINVADGSKKLVIKDLNGIISTAFISPTGKYIMWYDRKAKNYFTWDGTTIRNITAKIKVPLWDEENDTPDLPTPYGFMGWHEGDSAVYVYDRYDVWKVSPSSISIPKKLLSWRRGEETFRYLRTDNDKRFIKSGDISFFRVFDHKKKNSYVAALEIEDQKMPPALMTQSENELNSVNAFVKAKNEDVFLFTFENYRKSPDLYSTLRSSDDKIMGWQPIKLSSINPQQKEYNWGTAELFKWKAYNGKENEGIVYKPEDFDPKKKYPMICYFYETHSDGLFTYNAPSPTPSRLNIPFFVSRGYIVFSPDIHYGTGHPARDAYNHVVSGARALVKKGFVDSTRIGIQGQSWGGVQVAQLITMTKLFKAAWAGAPVANMTSAYGGIRWESGLNRQFQYEKSQSRIGATLWEKPNLYIENSPLFHLPKVTTPLVIMHNDADGAVPWYQGIELFTAMRRLNKKVWLLNYNGEAHNLVERRNRKDIQIREQQYFDWLLKDEAPPKWITEGVPAVKKGKDWGLDY